MQTPGYDFELMEVVEMAASQLPRWANGRRVYFYQCVFIFAPQIIRGLLKYWPKTCTQKEVRRMMIKGSRCFPFLLYRSSTSRAENTFCFFFLSRGRLGDVPRGDRGDPGCDRAVSVHPGSGAALQTDSCLHLQPALPGDKFTPLTPRLKPLEGDRIEINAITVIWLPVKERRRL